MPNIDKECTKVYELEFNLSEKLKDSIQLGDNILHCEVFEKGDVKEFIELEGSFIEDYITELLRNIKPNCSDFWIEKMLLPIKIKRSTLAGNKLI